MQQNYPNPFHQSTLISYTLSEPGIVSLKVYNEEGREIMMLANGFQLADQYEVSITASLLKSGVYFYKLSIDNHAVATRKMIVH